MCIRDRGKSVDSTMGFTALEGLPMGTRPGRLDAGVVLWMMEQGMSHDDIEHVLYHDCGMKGLSGISNDMRELLASDAPSAKLALKYFAWRVAEGMIGLGCAMNEMCIRDRCRAAASPIPPNCAAWPRISAWTCLLYTSRCV